MDLSKLSDADLAALQAGKLADMSDEGLAHLSSTPVAPSARGSILDRPNAVATGFNKGLTRFAGLPVDTVANVIDLGKAGLGSLYTKATGKTADALQLTPREDVVGSGDWLLKQAEKNALTKAATVAANPEYEGGYLQTAGAAASGLMNPQNMRDAAVQTARNVAGGLAGKFVGETTGSVPLAVLASVAPSVLSTSRVQPKLTAKDQTLKAAQADGYVVPPSQAGAGWVNARLESVAGKAALNQDAVQRNQETTNRVAARSLGLAPGESITHEALANLRSEAGGRGYAPIERIGDIPTTPNYANRIRAMEADIGNPNSPISSLRYPKVSELATELLPTSFTGPDANNLIKQLRETGNKGANIPYGGDQSAQKLGQAQLAGAKAIENLIDEHLLQFGPSNVVPNLRAARQEIAQSHTLEKALNTATGDVNAQVLASRVKSGKPITGDQKLIGDFAAAYPQLTKPSAGAPTPGVSALEAFAVPAAAMIGHGASGNASGLLAGGLPLLRSPARNMLLSQWYQKAFAKPPSKMGSLTPEEMGALSKMLLTSGVLEEHK